MSKKIINKIFKQSIKSTDSFATKCVKNIPIKGPVKPLSPPIFSSSTFILDSAEHAATFAEYKEIEGKSPYWYTRWGNPTTGNNINII